MAASVLLAQMLPLRKYFVQNIMRSANFYQDFCKLYTDRCVIGDQVGSATICGTTTKTVRLPNGVSIFRAELYAISMALNIIYRKKESKFIMFSDSMSSLQTLKGFKLEIDLIYQIIKDYSHLTESGKKLLSAG